MKSDDPLFLKLLKLFAISISASLFAKLFIDFIWGISTSFVAYDFDIQSYFDLSGVNFYTDNTSPLWQYDSQVSILLTKPISSMFMGLFALAGLILIKRKLISFYFLLFWINLYAFNNSAGIIVDDIIAKAGFYDVSVLFNFNIYATVIISVVAVYVLYEIGIVNTLAFRTSIARNFSHDKKTQFLLLIVSIILPWAFNFLIPASSDKIDFSLLIFLQNISMLIMFIPFFIYKPKKTPVTKVEIIDKVISLDWFNVIFYILGIALLYYVLSKGVFIYA